jgi:hypothetical protein
MPSTLKEEQLQLFPHVIDYIEEEAAAANISPAGFMVNRVVEMAEDRGCTHYDLPKPED